MKKHYLILFFSMIVTGLLNAQVIVSEDFDYTVDGPLAGANGGMGWASGWILDGPEQNVTEDTIKNYRTGKASGTLLKFSKNTGESSGNIRYLRQFSTPLTDDGNEYWLGFSMRIDSSGGNVTNFILTESTAPAGASLDLVIGKIFNGNLALGPNGAFQQTGSVDLLRENWLVAKISYSGGAGDDVVRLFVNPDPDVIPDDGDAILTYTGTGLDGKTLNSVLIRAEANPPNVVAYDDVYIGNNYSDVIPATALDIQKYLPVSEKFDYTAGNGLDTQGGTGDGWNGPWELISGSDHVISSTSISNPELLVTTGGNSLLIDGTLSNTRMSRRLENRYIDHGQNYWFGFNANFADADLDGGELLLILADTTFVGSGGAGQPVSFGKRNASDELGIMSFGAPFASIQAQVGANGSYWLVAKLEMSGDAEADTVRLFINPDLSTEPSVGTELAKFSTTKLNNGFQEIGFKYTSGATQALIDDIYLALDYQDIVPEDLANVAFPEPAFEDFNYTAGTIGGQGAAENGWSGPWQIVSGPDLSIVIDSIANVDIFRQTLPNVVQIDASAGATRMMRPLETRYEDNGLTYWLSFFAEFNSTTGGDVSVVMLVNNDTEVLEASGGNGQFAAIGKWTSAGSLAIGSFGPFGQTVATDVAEGTHWLVARIETNGTVASDTIRLFLNPDPNVEPSVGDELLKFAATELNGGWDAIGYKNDAGATTTLLDDIYLGSSYSEVIPGDLVDIEFLFTAGPTYEGFDYMADANLVSNGIRSDGWAGPWVQTAGDDIVMESGSIETEFTITEGNKALVNYTTDAIQYDRGLSGRFSDDGGSVWMSFLIDFRSATSINTEAKVILMDGIEEKIGFGRTAGFNRIGLIWDPEVFEFISNTDSEGENWIVVRIDFSGDDNPEDFYLWVNPNPEIQPDVNRADLVVDETSENRLALNSGFDGIRLSASGGPSVTYALDELRLGFSFSDITTVEEEVPENLIARDQFRYPEGESLLGLGSSGDQWAGPWSFGAGGGGPASIDAGNLSVSGIRGKDNSATVFGGTGTGPGRFARILANPIQDDGNEYWFSFIGKANQNVGQGGFGNASGDNTVLFGKRNPDAEVSILDIAGSGEFVKTTTAAEQNNWYVARIQFSGDDEADLVTLWMNPDPEAGPELDFPDAELSVTSLNDGISSVFFRAEGGVTEISMDEIHFGTTFESVVPVGDSGEGPLGLSEGSNLVNYPNPFRESTTFNFSLENRGQVQLSILDLNGRELVKILDGDQPKGEHRITWDGTGKDGARLSQGIYFYKFLSGEKYTIGRVLLLDK